MEQTLSSTLEYEKVENLEEFQSLAKDTSAELRSRREYETELARAGVPFVAGICGVCRITTNFCVNYENGHIGENGVVYPNWRETLVCSCNLNNRMRAAAQFVSGVIDRSEVIYITEQATSLYSVLSSRFPLLIGSEYLDDGTERGQHNSNGVRHEDLTKLTFASNSLDCILTFEVLEHVPDYKLALRESFRCLKNGGKLIFSVPFLLNRYNTLVRAKINESGRVDHIQQPEYHGDPINSKGILCFYHFGWELLDVLRSTGFQKCSGHLYWSKEGVNLGAGQILFSAIK